MYFTLPLSLLLLYLWDWFYLGTGILLPCLAFVRYYLALLPNFTHTLPFFLPSDFLLQALLVPTCLCDFPFPSSLPLHHSPFLSHFLLPACSVYPLFYLPSTVPLHYLPDHACCVCVPFLAFAQAVYLCDLVCHVPLLWTTFTPSPRPDSVPSHTFIPLPVFPTFFCLLPQCLVPLPFPATACGCLLHHCSSVPTTTCPFLLPPFWVCLFFLFLILIPFPCLGGSGVGETACLPVPFPQTACPLAHACHSHPSFPLGPPAPPARRPCLPSCLCLPCAPPPSPTQEEEPFPALLLPPPAIPCLLALVPPSCPLMPSQPALLYCPGPCPFPSPFPPAYLARMRRKVEEDPFYTHTFPHPLPPSRGRVDGIGLGFDMGVGAGSSGRLSFLGGDLTQFQAWAVRHCWGGWISPPPGDAPWLSNWAHLLLLSLPIPKEEEGGGGGGTGGTGGPLTWPAVPAHLPEPAREGKPIPYPPPKPYPLPSLPFPSLIFAASLPLPIPYAVMPVLPTLPSH